MMRALITAAVRRPVTTIMVTLGVTIFGIVALVESPVDYLPDVQDPNLVVDCTCRGLSPAEVRETMAMPIEETLSSLEGIKRVRSTSGVGRATVGLEFHWGTDMRAAIVAAREAIDAVYPHLPSSAEKPVVGRPRERETPVATLAVLPDRMDLLGASRLASTILRARVQHIDGIGRVEVLGQRQEEARIVVSPPRAHAAGLSVESVARILGGSVYDAPVGTMVLGDTEWLVRLEGRVGSMKELGRLIVATSSGGSSLRLEDISDISISATDAQDYFQVDGMGGVGLVVFAAEGASPVDAAKRLKREIEHLADLYRGEVHILLVHDSSRPIRTSIRDLMAAAAIGTLMAFAVMLVFLGDPALAALPAISIPISTLICLLLLRAAGRSLNIMSLGGLAMGIGMIVDNSVVVLENLQQGGGRRTVAQIVSGVMEVSSSTAGATLTSVVVFTPLFFIPGLAGALFGDLALAVCLSLGASYVVSVTLIPVLFSLLTRRRVCNRASAPSWVRRITRRYGRGLLRAQRAPWVAIMAVGVLMGGALLCSRGLESEILPQQRSETMQARVPMDPGSSMDARASLAADAAAALLRRPGIMRVMSWNHDDTWDGAPSIHLTVLTPRRSPATTATVQASLESLGLGARVDASADPLARLLGTQRSSVEILIEGPDPTTARTMAENTARRISLATGAQVDLLPAAGSREIRILPARESLPRMGLTAADVAASTRAQISGLYPCIVEIGGERLDIHVTGPEPSGRNDVQNLRIQTAAGGIVSLGEIAVVEIADPQPALLRQDRRDVALLRVHTDARTLSAVVDSGMMDTSFLTDDLTHIVALCGLALVLLYFLLGAQFASPLLPILLMLTLPVSLAGMVLALAVTGKSINIHSLMGALVLLGIVVNNTIVLFDSYRARLARGASAPASVHLGSRRRLRPILITALTTIAALLPIAVDPMGRLPQSSMAVAVIGGLAVSTLVTVYAVPLVFRRYLQARRR